MVLIPLTLCNRACVIILLLCSACHLLLGVELPYIPRVSMGVTLLVFSGGTAAHRPNNLWSSPPIQKSTIETTLKEFPSMVKWVVPGRNGVVQVKWVYTILPMKMVYRHDIKWRQIHRPTHASQMPDRLVLPIMQNSCTSMEVGSMSHMCHVWVEQIGLDYPEMCCLLCLMWPSQMALSKQIHCPQMALELRCLNAQAQPCLPQPALSWSWWVTNSF